MTTPDDDLRALDEHLRQYGRRPPEPKRMADVISQLLSRRGYAQLQKAAEFDAAWRQAAGEKFASHCRVGNLRKGVLHITVRNSAVLQELTFQKRKLLQTLVGLAADKGIRDLRFKVGEVD